MNRLTSCGSALSLALFLGVISGCASTGDLKEVRREALAASEEANRKAEDAMQTAEDAKRLAEDANMKAERNEEMLNRGFRKSMYK
jgi:hypothetical protein